jgi:hypothetical protein
MKALKFLLVLIAAYLFPALSQAQSYPPVFSSAATYVAGDLVQYGGNWYRAVKALTAHGPYPSAGYGSWELNYIRSNTTLLIGAEQTFPNVQAAWDFALNTRIADGAYLHLSISTAHGDLVNSFQGPFSLDHAFGAKISIIGDNTSNIFLGGSTGFTGNGFNIDNGHNLAMLSGITLVGQGLSGLGAGVSASGNASINLVGVQIFNFYYGTYAAQGGNMTIDKNSVIATSAGYAVYATQNANITLATGFTCNADTGYAILYASEGANIYAQVCTLDGNNTANIIGAYAEAGGSINVTDATISNCAVAVKAHNHGFVNAFSLFVSGNTNDFWAIENSAICADGYIGSKLTTDSGTGSYIY